jgi:hypothetical protein
MIPVCDLCVVNRNRATAISFLSFQKNSIWNDKWLLLNFEALFYEIINLMTRNEFPTCLLLRFNNAPFQSTEDYQFSSKRCDDCTGA